MSSAYDAVIFDLDGTLVDSVAGIGLAMNEALDDLNLTPHPLEAYPDFVGSGARVLVERALEGVAPERVEEGLARFLVRYETSLLRNTALYPGIPALLRALVARGLGLAVLSNKPHALTEPMVAQLLADVPWRQVWGHRPEVFPKKPDPASTTALLEAEGWSAARALFVGDTGIDIDTGRAAGLRPVGVAWGFRGREALRAHGAETILETPAELLDLL